MSQLGGSGGVQITAEVYGAALGCRNCRQGDRLRHPELPHATYCDMCPILTLGLETAVGPELPGVEHEAPNA